MPPDDESAEDIHGSPLAFGHRIHRTPEGDYRVRLSDHEREFLRSLPTELREALRRPLDPAVGRLFPPAHPDDPARAAEYADLVGGELLAGHIRSLEVLEATVDAERLDEEQIAAWMGAVNDVRLIMGTALDVDEELDLESVSPDDPLAPSYAAYAYLGMLMEELVMAVAEGLPSAPD